MDFEEIKALMQLFDTSKMNKMKLEVNDLKLVLEKDSAQEVVYTTENKGVEKIENKPIDVNGKVITSPIVGVFYNRRNPESEPFVRVGSQVKKGDCLCIIEAMKVMNEIVASQDGTVLEVLVENEELVEFDQPLFMIG